MTNDNCFNGNESRTLSKFKPAIACRFWNEMRKTSRLDELSQKLEKRRVWCRTMIMIWLLRNVWLCFWCWSFKRLVLIGLFFFLDFELIYVFLISILSSLKYNWYFQNYIQMPALIYIHYGWVVSSDKIGHSSFWCSIRQGQGKQVNRAIH